MCARSLSFRQAQRLYFWCGCHIWIALVVRPSHWRPTHVPYIKVKVTPTPIVWGPVQRWLSYAFYSKIFYTDYLATRTTFTVSSHLVVYDLPYCLRQCGVMGLLVTVSESCSTIIYSLLLHAYVSWFVSYDCVLYWLHFIIKSAITQVCTV